MELLGVPQMFEFGHVFEENVQAQASLLYEGVGCIADHFLGWEGGNEAARPMIGQNDSYMIEIAISFFLFYCSFFILCFDCVDCE